MPLQRLTHRRAMHIFPWDFEENLIRLREVSGLRGAR